MAEKAVNPRNVAPFLQKFRNVLMGRTHVPENGNLRYAKYLSDRDQPPPVFPPSTNSAVSKNPYCLRDPRRQAEAPLTIAENKSQKLLVAASTQVAKTETKAVGSARYRTPGSTYLWD